MIGIAGICFIFAYLIGVRKKYELIAGYNEKSASSVADKEGLGRLIARLCLLLGLGSLLMPVLTYFAAGHRFGITYCIGAYGGFIIGLVGMVILQSRDYTV